MANKTLVSIDDMIAKYQSRYNLVVKKIQDAVNEIHFDDSNCFDESYFNCFRDRIYAYSSCLPGMIDLISSFSDDFYASEMDSVDELRNDAISCFLVRRKSYQDSVLY